MNNQLSFLRKFITCMVAGLCAIGLLLMLGNGGNIPWLPPVVVFSLAGICLLIALVSPFVWYYKEKHAITYSDKAITILINIIRYTTAFNIASFGWKKIFGLQFVVPQQIADGPMSGQTGEWLTWFYFGYSPGFGLILAFIQIAGAILLLYKRTLLFGTVLLFSFLLNLCLINIFYGMNAGALLQSVVLLIGVSYLLLLHYKALAAFFFTVKSNLTIPAGNNMVPLNIYRLLIIGLSLAFTLYLKYGRHE